MSDALQRSAVRVDAAAVLVLYICLLIFVPTRLVISFIPFDVTPAMLVGLAALVWWFNARLVAGLGVASGWQPVRYVALLFLAGLLLSYAHAHMRPIGATAGQAADRGIVTMAAVAGITLLAADGVTSRARLDRVARVLVAAVTVISVLGILQFFTGVDVTQWVQLPGLRPVFALHLIQERSGFNRPAGTATHAIEYGVVLAAVLPLALHYALFAHSRRSRLLRWVGVGVLSAAMFMSLSRSAILGAIAAGLVLFLSWSPRIRWRALIVVPVFLSAMRLLVPGLIGTVLSMFVNIRSDPSYTGRTEDYPAALQAFSESKIFGQGFWTLTVILDNQYLGLLIETGVVGLAIVLGGFVVAIFTARGARLRSVEPYDRDLAQALAASVVVPLVAFLTFDALAFPMFTGVTFLCLGLCGAAWRLARSEEQARLQEKSQTTVA